LFRKTQNKKQSKGDNTCSMCGEYCAYKLSDNV